MLHLMYFYTIIIMYLFMIFDIISCFTHYQFHAKPTKMVKKCVRFKYGKINREADVYGVSAMKEDSFMFCK